MRGKDTSQIQYALGGRITPAYAGKSRERCKICDGWQDHPRLCGEKPALAGATRCISWITPAYAGKSRNGVFVRIAL